MPGPLFQTWCFEKVDDVHDWHLDHDSDDAHHDDDDDDEYYYISIDSIIMMMVHYDDMIIMVVVMMMPMPGVTDWKFVVGQGNSATCQWGNTLFPPAALLQVNGDVCGQAKKCRTCNLYTDFDHCWTQMHEENWMTLPV